MKTAQLIAVILSTSHVVSPLSIDEHIVNWSRYIVDNAGLVFAILQNSCHCN